MVILGLVGELDFFPSADASSFFGGFVAGMKRNRKRRRGEGVSVRSSSTSQGKERLNRLTLSLRRLGSEESLLLVR